MGTFVNAYRGATSATTWIGSSMIGHVLFEGGGTFCSEEENILLGRVKDNVEIHFTSQKYRLRPSPPHPANDAKWRGKRSKGNDGDWYLSRANSRGVYRWVKEPIKRRPAVRRKSRPLRRGGSRSRSRVDRRSSNQKNGKPIKFSFKIDIVSLENGRSKPSKKELDEILEAHLKMVKDKIRDFANIVGEEYLVDSVYSHDPSFTGRPPFSFPRLAVQGTSIVMTPSRPLAKQDVDAFKRVFNDQYGGYVSLDDVFGGVYIK